jgi:MFS family permease
MKPATLQQRSAGTEVPQAGGRPPGTWSALRHDTFRAFWAFSFLAFVGGSMQNVGAGWLMVALGGSPLQVSLIQGVMSLSVVIGALPAGAIADLYDRRVIMLAALAGLMLATGAIGWLSFGAALTPLLLLGFTFLFGLSSAAMTPAMQSLLPELVPHEDVASAVTLNGMSSSASRSVGPGIAGALIGIVGAGVTLMANVLAFVGLWVVILRWRPHARPAQAPGGERRIGRALLEGLAHAWGDRAFRALLVQTLACFFGAAAVLGLLPSLVDERFGDGGSGAAHYLGAMLSCYGVGSVTGSLAVAPIARRFDRRRALWSGTLACGASMLLLVASPHPVSMGLAMMGAGASWALALTCVNISAQLLLPRELLARGLSLSMMTLMISLAAGSAAWGALANATSVERAIAYAGCVAMTWPAVQLWRDRRGRSSRRGSS